MLIPNYFYQEPARTFTDSEIPLPDILPPKSDFIVRKVSTNDIEWDDVSIDYTQENGFFKGLLYALPAGSVFWVVLCWAVRALWMNLGGGAIGSG